MKKIYIVPSIRQCAYAAQLSLLGASNRIDTKPQSGNGGDVLGPGSMPGEFDGEGDGTDINSVKRFYTGF